MNIWVNGCFDIIHTGHIKLLWYAKLFETDGISFPIAFKQNKLFVGVDSDERVKILKGNDRPINNQADRCLLLSNLVMVDGVNVFNNDEELKQLIKTYDIDYIVVGDHYKDKRVIGSELTKHGVYFYKTDYRSSTNIINKIKGL